MAGVFFSRGKEETGNNRMAHQSASKDIVFIQKPSRQPGKPAASDVGSEYVCISWDAPEERDVTNYEVKLKPTADDIWSRVSYFTETDDPNKRIFDLDPATEYEFKVRAHYDDEDGPFSESSNPVMTKSPNSTPKAVSSRKPGTPEVTDVGSKYTSLTWDAPEDTDVTYYEIKLKPAADKAWYKMSLFTDDNIPYKQIDNLVHETAYEFRVRAHYNDEEGPFSNKSDPVVTKSLTISKTPGKPTVLDVGSDYVCIVWDEPEEQTVTYYEIKLKPTKDATWLKVSYFTDDDRPVMLIRDLDHDTEYEFKVRAHYESEEGPFSDNSNPVMTNSLSEAQPMNTTPTHPKKPGKPLATDTVSDYICLFWDKPRNEDVQYYEVKVKTISDKSWFKVSHFTDDSIPCKKIDGLDPATEYKFKVRGHYENEEGPYSEISDAIVTKQALAQASPKLLPRKPGKPDVSGVSNDCISLQWDEPQNTDVTYYEIKTKQAIDKVWNKVSQFTDDKSPFKQISNLIHRTAYEFKVRAHYKNEEGPFSDTSDPVITHALPVVMPSTNSRQPGKPNVTEAGDDYVSITWDEQEDKNVTYYEIKLKSSANEVWSRIPYFTDDDRNYKKIGDLDLETAYQFKVRAHYKNEEGPFSDTSDPVITHALPVVMPSTNSRQPGKPNVTEVGDDYVSIIWDEQEDKNVTYYEIKLKPSANEVWSRIPYFTDDDRNYKTIGDLDLETAYQFKVRAHYKNEEGPFSDCSDPVTTLSLSMISESYAASLPKRKPGKPRALDVGVDYIVIVWDKPENENLTEYEIYLQALDGSEWNSRVSKFTEGNKSLYCASGLFSSTTYKFTVQALYGDEEGESSDTSEPITTVSTEEMKGSSNTHASGTSGPLGFGTPRRTPTRPRKPFTTYIKSDCVGLSWDMPTSAEVNYFEIKYKTAKESTWNKNTILTKDMTSEHTVDGLLQETEYMFKVKAHFEDTESEYSDESDPVRTRQSPASVLKEFCMKLQDGQPAFYKLPLNENIPARNEQFKTRKLELGSSTHLKEKTMMMIGATGSGKSTLIDGMVNHLLGVKWEDDFRFKIIDLTTDEEEKIGRQTESQTDWITSYRIHPKIESAKYILNIIDTPGFGDTRGIKRDKQLVEQIRAFFSTDDNKGIEAINAICFVTQAPLARMTATQMYIFDAVLSIFGKDMAGNIVAMVTFADGKEPPVLNALDTAKVPYTNHFVFNNSALFEPNTDGKCNTFGQMFWNMGCNSFNEFFKCISRLETRSLLLTTEVLKMREQLNTTIDGLIPQINVGLLKLASIKQERDLVERFDREIRDNKNFRYTALEFHQNKIPLNPGEYVTNCTFCHTSCHFPCYIPSDENKYHCAVMKNGVCTVCPKKCPWDTHRNNDYRIEVKQVSVEKTYEQMKTKYEFAAKQKVSKESLVESIKYKFIEIKNVVCGNLNRVRDYGNYLRQNAIKANPLSELEYLKLKIHSEIQEKRTGFEERIKMLEMFKRNAELRQNAVNTNDTDEFLKHMGFDDI